jgi:hypothetical protein
MQNNKLRFNKRNDVRLAKHAIQYTVLKTDMKVCAMKLRNNFPSYGIISMMPYVPHVAS